MSCDGFRDRIAAAAACRVPLDAEVGEHLDTCAECRAEAAALRRAATVLRAAHVLDESASRRAPLFASAARAWGTRAVWLAYAAGAAAILIAIFRSGPPSAPPLPEPPPTVAWSGPGWVERERPGRFRLLSGGARFIAAAPFTVSTPVASVSGEGPADFTLTLEEVPDMSPRARRLSAGSAVAVAIVLVVTVQSGWLDVASVDDGPAQRVEEGETVRVESAPQASGPMPLLPAVEPADPGSPEPPDPRAAAIHGRISHPDGSPASGRTVWVWSFPARPVRTDADGRYRISGIPVPRFPQSLMIGPVSGGTSLGAVKLAAGEDRAADFTLRDGAGLSVVVTAGDRPAPEGVRVDVLPAESGSGRPFAAGTTSAGGAVRFGDLVPGSYVVKVQHEGWRRVDREIELAKAGEDRTLRISLTPAALLVFRLDGWTGEEASYVLMLKSADERPRGAGLHRHAGEVPASGLIENDAPPPGRYSAFLTVGGFRKHVPELTVPENGSVEIPVTMPGGVEVTGRVLRSDGRPVEGGALTLAPKPFGAHRPEATTTADGAFRFVRVAPGRYSISLTLAPPREEGRHRVALHTPRQTLNRVVEDLEVGPAGVAGLEITLLAGASIEGRMTGDLPGLIRVVNLSRRSAESWVPWGAVTPGPDGGFVARHLPPGRWRLTGDPVLATSSVIADPVEVDLAAGQMVKDVEIRWRKSTAVRLELVTPGGAPFTDAVSGILAPAGEGAAAPRLVNLEPDDMGLCSVPSVGPGDWTISIVGGPQKIFVMRFTVGDGDAHPVRIEMW